MFRRYAHVRQNDQSDCGAAALATIALHYRVHVGLQRLRDLTGTDRTGTNLLGIVDAAQKLGFEARAVHGSYENILGLPMPTIAHMRTSEGLGHFVVLHRVTRHKVVIADPARGLRSYSRSAFCDQWTGYLIQIHPSEVNQTTVAEIATVGPLRRFTRLLAQQKTLIFQAVLASLLMTVMGVAAAYCIRHLVDTVLAQHSDGLLNAFALSMTCVVVARVAFGALRNYLLACVSRRLDLALMADYSRHILDLPLSFFETRRVGEILSRISDAGCVRSAISGVTTTAIVDGLLVTTTMTALFAYDCQLALLCTAFALLMLISTAVHLPFLRRKSRKLMEDASQLSSHYVENVSGIEAIKAFGAQSQRIHAGESRLMQVVRGGFEIQALGNSLSGTGMTITGMAGVAILWFGGHRVMDGALTIGQLVFFHTLLGYLLGPLERLASINVQLQDALVAIDRLGQITDLPAEEFHQTDHTGFEGLRDAIELQAVTFQYGCRLPALDQLSLRIPSGKTVAIIGESGSGKSTLLKLLMGFYAPTSGRVAIDGRDLSAFDLASLRAGFGMVSQEPFLFTGSVRENIALGRPDATMTEIEAAAQAAGLGEFIDSLPLRYETTLGERGANLSGGQRQRLAIARVLLCDPHVIIFDEATSHLDTVTERVVLDNLRSTLVGKTIVLVAHRLSTVRDADIIYVLSRGHVIESGDHRELMQMRGHYAALWQSQLPTDVASNQSVGFRPRESTDCVGHVTPRLTTRQLACDSPCAAAEY